MGSRSHGRRSERFREDAYWAQVDQDLLAALRETLELQRAVEETAAGGSQRPPSLSRSTDRAELGAGQDIVHS
jgi:hypothetical protein